MPRAGARTFTFTHTHTHVNAYIIQAVIGDPALSLPTPPVLRWCTGEKWQALKPLPCGGEEGDEPMAFLYSSSANFIFPTDRPARDFPICNSPRTYRWEKPATTAGADEVPPGARQRRARTRG